MHSMHVNYIFILVEDSTSTNPEAIGEGDCSQQTVNAENGQYLKFYGPITVSSNKSFAPSNSVELKWNLIRTTTSVRLYVKRSVKRASGQVFF